MTICGLGITARPAVSYLEVARSPQEATAMRAIVRWIAIGCLAVPLAALAGHAFELPNKLALDASLWLMVQQQLYRGWGPVSAPFEIAALLACWTHAYLSRGQRFFPAAVVAALCLPAMLASFFLLNAPVNAAFAQWTPASMPADWPAYRWRWELGHLISFLLAVAALIALLRAAFVDREPHDARFR